MKDTYITLADYSTSLGITPDEARAKLDTEEYRGFYKEINGSEYVSLSIYSYQEKEPANDDEIYSARQDTPQETEESATTELERLRKEVDELRQTVRERDKQIADFAIRFAELAQQAQVLAGQAQVLQAANKPDAIEAQITAATEAEPQPKKQSFWKHLFS